MGLTSSKEGKDFDAFGDSIIYYMRDCVHTGGLLGSLDEGLHACSLDTAVFD